MKKAFVMFVLVFSLTILLAGCSKGESDASTSGTASSSPSADTSSKENGSSEPVTLNAFSFQSSAIQDYDNNDLTKFVDKKFNVNIKWTLAPEDSAVEKQQLLLASGNYPDVFFAGDFNQNDQIKYGKGGVLIPLNDLIKEYGPNIQAAFEQTPVLKTAVTAPDGNIYSLPGYEECYHCDYAQKLWINQSWLDKLELKTPATLDEFEQVLKAFKEKDPNGNGKHDEIALSGATQWWHGEPTGFIMNSFIYDNEQDYFRMMDGKVDFVANKPEWQAGLTYLKKLYDEGLIDPQAYTQQFEGLQKLADNPDVEILGAFTGGCCVPTVKADDPRNNHWVTVPPLKGGSSQPTIAYYGGSVDNGKFAITNKASKEQQIAAIKIVDYFYSQEGSITEMYGPKGIGTFDPKPGELGIDGKPALYEAIEPYQRDDKRSVTWDNDLKYTPTAVFNGRVQNQDINAPDGYEVRLVKMTDPLVPYAPKETFPFAVWIDPDKAQKLAQMRTDINNYVKQSTLQFITGQLNLNSDWDSYVKGFDGFGLDEYLKDYQTAYEQTYKK